MGLARVFRHSATIARAVSCLAVRRRHRLLLTLLSLLVFVLGTKTPSVGAEEKQARRCDAVRGILVKQGYFKLDALGKPLRKDIQLDLVYRMGLPRRMGSSVEKVNLYLTHGSLAVPYPPEKVVRLLSGFNGYHAWAMTDLNSLELHPNGADSWNFEITGIRGAKEFPGMAVDLRVFRFGRGGLTLRESERSEGGPGAPSVIHLVLGDWSLFVKRFTFTFFIFPLAGGTGSAVRFETEAGLRPALDWFFRGRENNPAAITKPRVKQFLRNVVTELERRAAARPVASF
ncbi:hypothetical protein ACFL59_01290 [Planctomycetota bacterium]